MTSIDVQTHTPIINEMQEAFDLQRRILYWQGFFTEDDDHDYKYFIGLFHPRVTEFILNHPGLQNALEVFRQVNPWNLLLFNALLMTCFYSVPIYINWEDKSKVIENFLGSLGAMMILFGVFTMHFYRESIQEVFNRLEKLCCRIYTNNTELLDTLRKKMRILVLISKIVHFILMPSVANGLTLLSIFYFHPRRVFLLNMWLPYDEKVTPAYEMTLFVVIFDQFLSIFAAVSLTFVSTIMYLTIGNIFTVINDNLTNIRAISEGLVSERLSLVSRLAHRWPGLPRLRRSSRGSGLEDMAANPSQLALATFKEVDLQKQREVECEMEVQLATHVDYHKEILEIASDYNDVQQLGFMVMFLFNIGLFGATAIILVANDIPIAKKFLYLYLSSQAALFFLAINVIASIIADESEAVSESLYFSDWLDTSKSFKRSMLIIMLRANNPVEFQAIGVEPLSISFFGEVTKSAYEMCTTFRELVNKK